MGQANGYQERSRRKSFALPYVRWRKTSIRYSHEDVHKSLKDFYVISILRIYLFKL